MITLLSSDHVDEVFIRVIFDKVLETTLKAYRKSGYNNLEPMGSKHDMYNNMSKIAGSILRACQTYYDTAEEQLVQIISSITINHYLENGNKRTAVSAGLLYLTSYAISNFDPIQMNTSEWVVNHIEHLKHIADAFANKSADIDEVRVNMISYAHENIFSEISNLKSPTNISTL